MSDFRPYEPCWECSGYPQPGTKALMQYLILRFPQTWSMGIYNCRDQVGSSALSTHGCGKAGDSGVPTTSTGGPRPTLGNPVVQFLIKYANELGIMGIIYNRIRYDDMSPRGRTYTGPHPHYDHIHWEQVLAMARSLTLTRIIKICGPVNPAPPIPTPAPTDWTKKVIMALPTLREGDGMGAQTAKAPDVKRVQGLLIANGFEDKNSASPKTGVDGKFGSGTKTAVMQFQASRKLKVDGICGQGTWTKLLGE